MTYEKLFDSAALEQKRPPRPDVAVAYLYHPDLELAVNVALAAGRPLLLTGLPGTGKSSIAADIAWKLGRRYYQEVITSRTQAQDLQWRFDLVRRLSDATGGGKVDDDRQYVEPGVLWRAFAPDTAATHGRHGSGTARSWGDQGEHAVVLLDEIDKAEPDVPNDLLFVLDANEFLVTETQALVKKPPQLELLIVITSNGERALPPAFVRRCVTFEIEPLDEARLKDIACRHFPEVEKGLLDEVYTLYTRLGADARAQKLRSPSTAELLDALRACRRLKIASTDDSAWKQIAHRAMWKHKDKKGDGDKKGDKPIA